ncbi:hypothetical protein C8T65DRAFT_728265 [Cerioporus squamosus]|nr:hypothetical protein C8T65DRAFT_728265 [Cerioporus squamosus]
MASPAPRRSHASPPPPLPLYFISEYDIPGGTAVDESYAMTSQYHTTGVGLMATPGDSTGRPALTPGTLEPTQDFDYTAYLTQVNHPEFWIDSGPAEPAMIPIELPIQTMTNFTSAPSDWASPVSPADPFLGPPWGLEGHSGPIFPRPDVRESNLNSLIESYIQFEMEHPVPVNSLCCLTLNAALVAMPIRRSIMSRLMLKVSTSTSSMYALSGAVKDTAGSMIYVNICSRSMAIDCPERKWLDGEL